MLTIAQITLSAALWSAFWVVAGWLCNHWFSKARDRDTGRRNFLAFLGTWRSEIERIDPKELEKIWSAYKTRVHDFHGHVARLEGDFWRANKFRNFCDPLGDIPFSAIRDSALADRRNMIAGPIDRLKEYY